MPSGQESAEPGSLGQQQQKQPAPQTKVMVKPKGKTGFVGLKNMGCICYMNSTLQQVRGMRRYVVVLHCYLFGVL